MSSVPPAGPPAGSIPPIPPIMPPPEYTGDQPTVQNPVYRDSTDPPRPSVDTAARGGTSAGVTTDAGAPSSATATRDRKSTQDDEGRRGNIVMGAMLVVGLLITGAAGVMLSSGSGDASERVAGEASDAAASDAAGADDEHDGAGEVPIAAARQDSADSAGLAGTPLNDSPAAFGETITVLDGVEVTVESPRSFSPSGEAAPADTTDVVAVEATAVNGSDREQQIGSELQMTGDLADLQAPGSDESTAGFDSVEDSASGLAAVWSGGSMEPGGTAYGLFGFGVPSDAPDKLYVVVWLDAPTEDEPTEDAPTVDAPTVDDPTEDDPTEDDPTVDDPAYVVFAGPRP